MATFNVTLTPKADTKDRKPFRGKARFISVGPVADEKAAVDAALASAGIKADACESVKAVKE